MSQPESIGQPQKRPLHISVASLGTNASGIAESTLSYASDFTVSQFPVPPVTPTGSSITPTTPVFVRPYPPAIPDYATPTHFEFGTPPSSRPGSRRSDVQQQHGGVDHMEADYRSTKSGASNKTQKTERPPLPPLHLSKPLPEIEMGGRRAGVSPSSTLVATAHTGKRVSEKYPPVSHTNYHERPGSPASLVAESSLYHWSDAGSGISVNPSEERLLSTSFITSLLSQSPEPRLAPSKPGGKTKSLPGSTIHTGKSRSSTHTASSKATRQSAAPTDTHQSFPASVSPSDLYSPVGESLRSPDPRQKLAPMGDDLRTLSGTEENSEMLHATEGQLVSAVRSTSLAFPRGMNIAHAMKVEPAYLVPAASTRNSRGPSELVTACNQSTMTSTSFSSKPPSHIADTPQDVRMARPFDTHGIPRESEEDFMRSSVDVKPGDNNSAAGAGPSRRSRLQRNNSLKSVVSSLVSRISHTSAAQKARYMMWLRNRPLPPLPPIPNQLPGLVQREDIKKSEEGIPLPMLAMRADMLRGRLDRGFSKANSDYVYKEGSNVAVEYYNDSAYSQITEDNRQRASSLFSRISRMRSQRRRQEKGMPPAVPPLPDAQARASSSTDYATQKKRRRLMIIVAAVIVVLILVIAIPAGVVEHNKHHDTVVCSGNMTGAGCTLDATCVCTNTGGGACKPLARSLSLLVPTVNSIFSADFTGSQLSDAVVGIVGTSTDGLCAKQARLVDVEPGLDSASAPNRTAWAQSAILWNVGMSQDVNATTRLQEFVSSAPWKELSAQTADGPSTDADHDFAFVASGYTFDFAAQTVVPLSQTFVNAAKPTDAQLAEVSVVAGQVLDRMYSYALASSTQRLRSLENYWTSVLQQQASDLTTFVGAVQASPFLIPFDATSSPGGQALTQLMSNTTNTPFPPPLACYPGLSSTTLARVNELETSVFNLSSTSSSSQFSTSCFPNRPVYGVVDLLRMRLPFPDNRTGVALQASALSSDATARAVLYSGEVLSALPGAKSVPNIEPSTTDPREFGVTNAMNHVLLNYFSSISNLTLAMNLISHVLTSTGPPTNGSDLANALSTGEIPILEFALFGSVLPQDIASSVSSFSTPSGGLFFGSNAGQAFREWALVDDSETVSWTQSALSTQVVHESPTVNSNFESVWKPASELVSAGATDASDVQKVISSLNSLNLFSLS